MSFRFINSPEQPPQGVQHRTFFSPLAGHEVGCNIYLPRDYHESDRRYPLVLHLHGWMCHESSDIHAMEKVYAARDAITVFPNYCLPVDDLEHFPLEERLLEEFLPCIEREYRTIASREGRHISGFSMGGGLAFYYAVKHPELFSSVTAYAGTYHHYFDQEFATVGAPIEQAAAFRETILGMNNPSEKNILHWLNRQADAIRGKLKIEMRVGTEDILHCDNEITHLHLDSLHIPHTYVKIPGAGHHLEAIV